MWVDTRRRYIRVKISLGIYLQGYGYCPVYQGDDTSFTCTGLQRVTNYNFRLTATNEKGQSPASPSVMYKTLPSIPGPPAAPSLKDRPTPSALNIAWQEPTDNGGAEVQTYILQMSECALPPGSTTTELVDVYVGPDKAHRVEELLPGRRYETRVSLSTVIHVYVYIP